MELANVANSLFVFKMFFSKYKLLIMFWHFESVFVGLHFVWNVQVLYTQLTMFNPDNLH